MAYKQQKGFSLLELMVTVAILGVLVAMSSAALSGLRSRADISSTAAEITATFKAMKQRAQARNIDVWFGVLVPSEPTDSIEFIVLEDPTFSFDPSTVAFGDVPPGTRLDQRRRLPRNLIALAEDQVGGWGDAPEDFLPVSGAIGASGCSFCDSSGVGWILALPSGEIQIWNGAPDVPVEALVLSAVRSGRDSDAAPPRLVVFTVPFGLVESYRLDP